MRGEADLRSARDALRVRGSHRSTKDRLRRMYARREILGCPVDAVSINEVVLEVRRALAQDVPLQIVPCNVDFVMKARHDVEFSRLLRSADLVIPDGMPVVWAASLLNTPLRGRVSGTDLVWECARVSAEERVAVALVGSLPGVADRASVELRRRHPGAELYSIPTPMRIGEEDSTRITEAIRNVRAKIVLVAFGAPRQEKWIQENLRRAHGIVGIGIGSAFDIISGDRPQAPNWLRDHGFEWFHRMRQEPRRLGRRYLIDDSPFLYHVALEILRRRGGRLAEDDSADPA